MWSGDRNNWDRPTRPENILRSISHEQANFTAVIAGCIQHWCWQTDEVFRAPQRASCEAQCRTGCEMPLQPLQGSGDSANVTNSPVFQSFPKLPKVSQRNSLGICAGAQNDVRPQRSAHFPKFPKTCAETSEVLKIGASGNLPRINFRLPKTAEQVALQAQRLQVVTRKKDPCSESYGVLLV